MSYSPRWAARVSLQAVSLVGAAALGFTVSLSSPAAAQEAPEAHPTPGTAPTLGLEAPKDPFRLYQSRRYANRKGERNYYETPELHARQRRRPYGWYHHYYAWPWHVPMSYKYDLYPPPVAYQPRLGLQYSYPYAYQMGIQMPYDEDPLETYSLGPFRGVVRSPQRPEWLYRQAGIAYGVEDRWGITLMREGRFQEAGRLLARGFRDSDDPGYPLHLAEALFGLGKHRHAELVLRHALEQDGVFDVLPDDVAAHFPSRDDFETKVGTLVSSGESKLLAAYLLLFSRDGSKGLDALSRLMQEDLEDETLARLYRHFLGKAFGAEASAPDPAASRRSD